MPIVKRDDYRVALRYEKLITGKHVRILIFKPVQMDRGEVKHGCWNGAVL